MKPFVVACVLCISVAAAPTGQMTKYGVTVAADKNVDFAKLRTYSWTPGQPAADKTLDAQIVATVDRELGALGMSRATSGPGDVLATYFSVSRTDVNPKAKSDSRGFLPQYTVGTLIVAFLEPGSRRRLLRLRIDRPIDTAPAQLEAAIDSAVAEMFTKYPTHKHR